MQRRKFISTISSVVILLVFAFSSFIYWLNETKRRSGHSVDEREQLEGLMDEFYPAVARAPSASQAGLVQYMKKNQPDLFRSVVAAVRKIGPTYLRSDLYSELHKRSPALFGQLRQEIIKGYFAHPRHGGNRNFVAWRGIRFKNHFPGSDYND